MKILILNGPNLNLLGRRQPEIYGSKSMEEILGDITRAYPETEIEYFQSNHEGELIDALHRAWLHDNVSGIVFNAGAYTHTSIALADAIAAVEIPVVEVHLSNVSAREPVRRQSMIAPVCCGTIAGFGADSYRLGVEALLKMLCKE
ncbi:MAG: type II 3-dehydroquinate dehydratase [Muribaculaceae bacterium]|nr:type II 3-dehydroquinate dehydratase [Muribaculaceae bacterium]